MTHTPGPWKYRPLPLDDWGIVRADDYVICQARDPNVWKEDDLSTHRRNKTDPWEANARLISAAPELYEYALAIGQWEADLIMDIEAWETGNPAIPQHLWDRWMKLQALRLSATAKTRGTT